MMGAKITSAILTCVFNLAMAVVIFAMMIIVMNGFSGSDAQWGMLLYVVLALVITVLGSVGAAMFANKLARGSMHPALIILASSAIFTVVGTVLMIVSCFAGVITADVVRRNF